MILTICLISQKFDQRAVCPPNTVISPTGSHDALKSNNIAVLLDVVVNHKMGADEERARSRSARETNWTEAPSMMGS